MRVRIVKNCCIPFEGHDYTQADGAFELPDASGKVLVDSGTCVKADMAPAGDDNAVSRTDAIDTHLDIKVALLAVLAEAGYTTLGCLVDAHTDDLIVLRGIGEKTAAALKNTALELINGE